MGTRDPRGRFYMQSKVNFRRRVAINPSHEEFHYACSQIQESSGLIIFPMSKRRYLIFQFIDQLADVALCHLNCKIVQLLKSKFYTCTSEHLSNLICAADPLLSAWSSRRIHNIRIIYTINWNLLLIVTISQLLNWNVVYI